MYTGILHYNSTIYLFILFIFDFYAYFEVSGGFKKNKLKLIEHKKRRKYEDEKSSNDRWTDGPISGTNRTSAALKTNELRE